MFGRRDLAFLDGIAIICIVLHHAQINWILCQIGLSIFTMTSGYKLAFNHHENLENRSFLMKYALKRIIRLYKPYVGYTLLILPLFYVSINVAQKVFNLKYPGLLVFEQYSPIQIIENFVLGNNLIVGQLWYLIALIAITIICLFILYVTNVTIFFLTIPIWILFSISYPINRIIIYLPLFMVGVLLGYYRIGICMPLIDQIVYIGYNSFYIYLFHNPLILPIAKRFLQDILGINNPFMPIILTAITIPICILTYRATKLVGLNKMFE